MGNLRMARVSVSNLLYLTQFLQAFLAVVNTVTGESMYVVLKMRQAFISLAKGKLLAVLLIIKYIVILRST